MILAPPEKSGGDPWPLPSVRRELAPVANRPLIELELEALHGVGIREVGVVSDPELAAAAREAAAGIGLDLFHIAPPPKDGLAARLLAAEPFVGQEPFVAELAGSLTRHDLRGSVELVWRKRLAALVVVPAHWSRAPQVIPLRRRDGPPGGGLAADALTGAGSFVFGPEIFDAARRVLEARGGEAGLADAVEELAERQGRVQAVQAAGWSKRIETVEDLFEVNRLLLSELPAEADPERLRGNRVMGPVAVAESAAVEASVLNGPLAIACDARIADSYIGPYTAIGAGATLDGVEIERSLVLAGATIERPGARIEGSLIGPGARVTRDFGPPRALRVWVDRHARVSLV